MNILGVGTAELVVIFMIMIVVVGPKRMIHWAYWIGVYFGKARHIFTQMMVLVQEEMKRSGVEVELPKEVPTRAKFEQWSRDALKPVMEPLEKTLQETKEAIEGSGALEEEEKNPSSERVSSSKLGSWGDLLKAQPRANTDLERFSSSEENRP